LREARKLGFARAVVPEGARADTADTTLAVTAVGSLASLVAEVAAQSVDRDRRVTKLRQQDG
jgi:predicted ATP-dependent serine protease